MELSGELVYRRMAFLGVDVVQRESAGLLRHGVKVQTTSQLPEKELADENGKNDG